ncbi:zinc ribbon domain-containing protein [Arsenicitalea aurantiaca]|uniref:Zinc ribbon domain-containing protein n=1 Tax=Arsenicitalea aurantiaca TaxID=1783274 RepID=A0A433X2B8_9HYPH|nr:zinc ribbon domain-containing protein [Arsenicitalea aurantiaca]RUT28243.1 zinc ribbon domain-containing protein [Arsenicitalea aurantiaca]
MPAVLIILLAVIIWGPLAVFGIPAALLYIDWQNGFIQFMLTFVGLGLVVIIGGIILWGEADRKEQLRRRAHEERRERFKDIRIRAEPEPLPRAATTPHCPQCDADRPASAKFCVECGAELLPAPSSR